MTNPKERELKIKESRAAAREALNNAYSALNEKGYTAIDQLVGYLRTGDPTYVTTHHDARLKLSRCDLDDILEVVLRSYFGLND